MAWILPAIDAACLYLCIQGSVLKDAVLQQWWQAENKYARSVLVLLFLTWSSEPGLLGFALWWPWWVVVSTACHGFLAPQHFWTHWSFFRLLRKFVETSRERYLNICYPWEGFAFASSLSHFLLPLLSSALEKPLHWATACSLLRVVTCRQLWTQSSLNQTHSENMKYSLMFITEEMEWLNAGLFIANLYKRENSDSYWIWM